ncbi:hypothetical protein LAZ67_7003593 [Cordylochernes scorpioides]|uniref:Dynein light chain n=1 Tax=Cordylochernes scorpioides TaxID=51811 RepID=A0ABY6KSK0_9ARAC|nr:hypothetical protein LAZ67_7003593 [Cordylochernes scorpioides]
MTLILSVVFVIIFILSWWWMAFAVRQAKEDVSPAPPCRSLLHVADVQGTVSLRTVLLLAVFAAVDVAASAGFILLRIIMYARRDYLYPRDLRTPVLATEHDQLASYAAMRLITLHSSCGSTDVLVIVVVGFLTCLRVYSVVCVFSYYKRAKDSPSEFYQHQTQESDLSCKERIPNGGSRDDFVPRPLFSGQSAGMSKRQPSEISAAEPELRVQAADMPPELQKAAMQSAAQALRLYATEKLIAECIKQDFDHAFGPTWHCIVGRHWGSCVTHSKQCYIRISCRDLTILLYKST